MGGGGGGGGGGGEGGRASKLLHPGVCTPWVLPVDHRQTSSAGTTRTGTVPGLLGHAPGGEDGGATQTCTRSLGTIPHSPVARPSAVTRGTMTGSSRQQQKHLHQCHHRLWNQHCGHQRHHDDTNKGDSKPLQVHPVHHHPMPHPARGAHWARGPGGTVCVKLGGGGHRRAEAARALSVRRLSPHQRVPIQLVATGTSAT